MSAWGEPDDSGDEGAIAYFSEDSGEHDARASHSDAHSSDNDRDSQSGESQHPSDNERHSSQDELDDHDPGTPAAPDDPPQPAAASMGAAIESILHTPPTHDMLFGASVETLRQNPRNKRKRRRRGERRRGRGFGLSRHAQSLMGQANLAFVRRDFPAAIELLKEVIREAPGAVAPYHTLALIYEDQGEHKKALDFSMIASHRNPGNADLWKRNAAAFYNFGEIETSLYCLNRGYAASNRKDQDFLRARALVYRDKTKQYVRAANDFAKVFHASDDPASEIEAAQDAVDCYLKADDSARAAALIVDALPVAEKECFAGGAVPADQLLDYRWTRFLTTLSKVYLEQQQYSEAVTLLNRCKLVAESHMCRLPAQLLLRLDTARLCAGSTGSLDSILERLKHGLEDIAQEPFREAVNYCIQARKFTDGLRLVDQMVMSAPFNGDINLHLQRASCLSSSNQLVEAAVVYRDILTEAPDNQQAKLGLQLLEQGDVGVTYIEQCLQAIVDPDVATTKQLRILEDGRRRGAARQTVRKTFESCEYYIDQGDLNAACDAFCPIVTDLTVNVRGSPDDLGARQSTPSSSILLQAIGQELSELEFVGFLNMLWVSAYQCGDRKLAYASMRRMSENRKVKDKVLSFRIVMLLGKAALGAEKTEVAVRLAQSHWMDTHAGPELVYLMWKHGERIDGSDTQSRVARNFSYLTRKHWSAKQVAPALMVYAGLSQFSHMANTSLRRHVQACFLRPEEPILHLLCGAASISPEEELGKLTDSRAGVDMMFKAMTRTSLDRHRQVLQSAAFLSVYREKRACSTMIRGGSSLTFEEALKATEVAYNLGRVFHHAGIRHLAVHFYRQALVLLVNPPEGLDIRKEAAFNLATIYAESGSAHLANSVLRKYMTIF